MVTLKQEYVVIGQRKFEVQIQVFSFGEHMSILDKIMLRKCAYGKARLNSNKGCITAVIGLWNQFSANHKIASFKTGDSAILSNWLIQLDDRLNDILLDIEAHH